MRNWPPVGVSISETMRARVDLPQPDSPTTARVLPAWTEKDTPPTACKWSEGRMKPRRISYTRLRSLASTTGWSDGTGLLAMALIALPPPRVCRAVWRLHGWDPPADSGSAPCHLARRAAADARCGSVRWHRRSA